MEKYFPVMHQQNQEKKKTKQKANKKNHTKCQNIPRDLKYENCNINKLLCEINQVN